MDDYTQFTMRMQNDVYNGLKARAERNRRSIAKELEHITEQALAQDAKELEERIKKLLSIIDQENLKEGELEMIMADDKIQSPAKDEILSLLRFLGIK